jgi:hypothetical protein
MTNYEGRPSDAAILAQMRELAGRISDERTRVLAQNVISALELNPQPLPPAMLRTVLEALALDLQPQKAAGLNPQPLPPEERPETLTPRA